MLVFRFMGGTRAEVGDVTFPVAVITVDVGGHFFFSDARFLSVPRIFTNTFFIVRVSARRRPK